MISRGLILGLLLVPAGCMATDPRPEAHELAAIRPWTIVPASSPAQLVKSFEQTCLDGPRDPDAAARRLRGMNYVEVTRAQRGTVRRFAVDDSRPAVLIAPQGCAVAVQSRTGQTEALRRMIARRLPDARPLAPDAGTEAQWLSPSNRQVIVLRRHVRPGRPAQLMVLRLDLQPARQ